MNALTAAALAYGINRVHRNRSNRMRRQAAARARAERRDAFLGQQLGRDFEQWEQESGWVR